MSERNEREILREKKKEIFDFRPWSVLTIPSDHNPIQTTMTIEIEESNMSPEAPSTTKSDDDANSRKRIIAPPSKAKDETALASSKPSIRRLFQLMNKAEKNMIFVSFLLVVGSEAANLLTPLIVANAYDVLVDPTITDEEERMSQINYYMVIAIVVTVAGIIAGFLRVTIQVCKLRCGYPYSNNYFIVCLNSTLLLQGVVGERVVARLRCRLYSQILKQG